MSGDIEALADRLAGIRSWAYIAHRSDWLKEPAKWAERTREVEARLSDALHERLTQRFVDRRTAVLVRDIGARGADALPVTVAADGEVSVGPEPIGHLTGFDFRVDPNARLADKRLLLAAAERRLGDELDRRANALVDATDETFELIVDEAGGPAVGWEGHVLARLAPGRSLLEPALRTARALDRLSAHEPRRAARAGSNPGSTRRSIAICARSSSLPRPPPTPPARPAYARSRRCSPMPAASFRARRCSARSRTSSRPTATRFTGSSVRLGPLDVFLLPLLKPVAQHWRAALLAVRTGQTMPGLPSAGAATLAGRCRPARRRARLPPAGSQLAPHRPCRSTCEPRAQGALGRRRQSRRPRLRDFGRPRRRGDRPADERSRLHPGRRRLALARPTRAARRPPRRRRPMRSRSWRNSRDR